MAASVMCCMLIHNHFHVFSSLGFVFAFVMGIYDGMLAGYIWHIITEYFEDRFLAMTTATTIFMFHMGMFTGMSIEVLDYDNFLTYFILTTAFAFQSIVGFYHHFKWEKPGDKLEGDDNLKDMKKRISQTNLKSISI